MCGRFALVSPPETVRQLVDFINRPNFPPRYNIAPTQAVAIVRASPQNELALAQWGLVPAWMKPEQVAERGSRPQINARGETITEKPFFKNAFRRRRCLIPADGFYEWDRKIGQPYLIHRVDQQPFFMAGIWEIWSGADGSELETCAIITVAANDRLASVHHRMPAMIAPQHAADWLHTPETQTDSVIPLLVPAPEPDFTTRPISRRVNKASEEGADLWREEHVAPDPPKTKRQLDLFS